MKRKAVNKQAVKKNQKKKHSPKSKRKARFSKADLDIFREKLLNLKDDILNQISDIAHDTFMKSQEERSDDISGYGLHLADSASEHYERDFSLDLVSEERKIVLEIDAALKRIDEGTYGICSICGHPIPKARLNAIPYTRYDRACQEKLERENKL